MTSMLAFADVVLLACLTGCATGWARPDTSKAEFDQDLLQCEQLATSRHPVRIEAFGSGHAAPSRSNCSSFGLHLNCSAIPGTSVPAGQHDANASARANDIRSCLQSRGYVAKPLSAPSHSIPQHSPEREEFIG